MFTLSVNRSEAFKTADVRKAKNLASEIRAEYGFGIVVKIEEHGSRYFLKVQTDDMLGWYVK